MSLLSIGGQSAYKHRYLPLSVAAKNLSDTLASVPGLSSREHEILKIMIESCPQVVINNSTYVRMADLDNFGQNVLQAFVHQDGNCLLQKRGLCVDKIVDVVEFVESRDYMNQQGSARRHVLDGLSKLFSQPNYVECVLGGAIGWGKSYMAEMAMAYLVYTLSCYHNPQLDSGLAPGTSIVFIQQSKSYELARKVLFDQFAERLRLSPYFSKYFPFDNKVKSELRFPKNIFVIPVGGNDTSALGMNVFGGIIDEMNFMARVRDSELVRYSGEEEYDQAERLYRTLLRRMKSRFIQKGTVPGKLVLISSANYEDDFIDRKFKEARTDETILALRYNQWETLPQDRLLGPVFWVEVGNDTKHSRILDAKEEAVDAEDVIEVPIEYRRDFERDLEHSLKEYAGITTGISNPFIPYRELILKAQEEYMKMTGDLTLFKHQEVFIDDVVSPENPNWFDLVSQEYLETVIFDKSQVFTVHIDVGISEDAVGVAVARLAGYKLLPASRYLDPKTQEFVEIKDIRAPIYVVDGILRVVPPRDGREVDLELVRDLILWLRGHLFIKWASMDSYQSQMMIQSFRKCDIRSGVLSIDTNIAPYAELKLAIKDERIYFPPHATLAKELRELEKDKYKDKVDHKPDGSKDCSDAVAGAIYLLQRKEAFYGRTGRYNRESVTPQNLAHRNDENIRKVRLGRTGRGAGVSSRLRP